VEGRRRAKAVLLLAAEGGWPTPARLDAVIVDTVDHGEVVRSGMMLALHASRAPSAASELHAIEAILAHGDGEANTVKEIAAQTGMAIQTVRRRLRLRKLIPALRAAFDRGAISITVAEAGARLAAEPQARLGAMLAGGERLTLHAVREVARERTAIATEELPASLFGDRDTPWGVTVRAHVHAALQAIPEHERGGDVAEILAGALIVLEPDGRPRAAEILSERTATAHAGHDDEASAA
jgi:hypothetical protein